MKLSTDQKKAIVNSYLNGESVTKISRDSGVARSTIYYWISHHKPLKSVKGTSLTLKDYDNLKRKYEKQSKILHIINQSRCFEDMPLEEKLEIYSDNSHLYSSHILCEALNISRGTYYNRILKDKQPTYFDQRKNEIYPLILKIFEDSDRRFGADKIQMALKNMGIDTSKKYILKLMHELGIQSISVNAKKEYSKLQSKQNIVARAFDVSRPNEIWVSDITCFKVNAQYFYICAIMDLFSRKIIAYKVSTNQTARLITSTFKPAFSDRNQPKNLIFHSDRGAQYTSRTFMSLLKKSGIKQSFSGAGKPHDNAVIESFFAILKKEELYRRKFKSERDFRQSVDDFMKFYNEERPHRYNKYRTPVQKEVDFYLN